MVQDGDHVGIDGGGDDGGGTVTETDTEGDAEHGASKPTPEPDAVAAKVKNMHSAQSHNVWHLAADWCEVFAPCSSTTSRLAIRATEVAANAWRSGSHEPRIVERHAATIGR